MSSRWASRDAVVTFYSGSGQTMTWGPGPGDISFGEMNAENVEYVEVRDRGSFDGLVPTDDLVQEGQITIGVVNAALTSTGAKKVWDSVMKTGMFLSDTSLDPDAWVGKVVWAASRAANAASITLPYCRIKNNFSEARDGDSYTFSFRNFTAPTVT